MPKDEYFLIRMKRLLLFFLIISVPPSIIQAAVLDNWQCRNGTAQPDYCQN
jgi:hypothetical protein